MKEMNKWQIKAAKENANRVASGELSRIADKAINAARIAMAAGIQTIDASDMVNSDNALARHIGNQMDGYAISGKTSAEVELNYAAREIYKIGKASPEARAELNRIESVKVELGLNE